MTALRTGLGARLCSSDVHATAFAALPVIDLAPLAGDDAARQALAKEVQTACIQSGFFYIKNHGVSNETLAAAFAQAKVFFAQPLEKKMLVDMHNGSSFKGYLPMGGEQVDPDSRGDLHEAFDIGSDSQAFSSGKKSSGNQYPPAEDLPEFKPAIENAWNAIMDLGKRLFPIFALALDLTEHYFDEHLTDPGSVMRILHYPSQPQDGPIDPKELGIGAHTDYECFTLLAQEDGVEALQVLNADGEWIRAPPLEGTFVCNIGDQLQRWTNDVFKSTVHRAINRTGKERHSLPFFFGVNYDSTIEVLPSCIGPDRPAKYPPVKAAQRVEKARLASVSLWLHVDGESAKLNSDPAIRAIGFAQDANLVTATASSPASPPTPPCPEITIPDLPKVGDTFESADSFNSAFTTASSNFTGFKIYLKSNTSTLLDSYCQKGSSCDFRVGARRSEDEKNWVGHVSKTYPHHSHRSLPGTAGWRQEQAEIAKAVGGADKSFKSGSSQRAVPRRKFAATGSSGSTFTTNASTFKVENAEAGPRPRTPIKSEPQPGTHPRGNSDSDAKRRRLDNASPNSRHYASPAPFHNFFAPIINGSFGIPRGTTGGALGYVSAASGGRGPYSSVFATPASSTPNLLSIQPHSRRAESTLDSSRPASFEERLMEFLAAHSLGGSTGSLLAAGFDSTNAVEFALREPQRTIETFSVTDPTTGKAVLPRFVAMRFVNALQSSDLSALLGE